MDIRRVGTTLTILLSLFASWSFAASFGRIPAEYSISPAGTAQYSIPIWSPPGVRGVQPNLSVTYDSGSGYGILGPGWTLSGLSAITRCSPTFAQDPAPAPITLTSADGFCIDGNRLRSTGAGQYMTEIANFSKITASGTAGTGPSYFTVQGKDGWTYEYGNTADSKIIPPGSSTPYVWALDKVTDLDGNYMKYTYFVANGSYVPLTIEYTYTSNTSIANQYHIDFAYTNKSASDALSKSVAGNQVQQTEQLSTITVYISSTIERKYTFKYTTSTGTLRATLTSIEECGGSAATDCLPDTTVAYQQGTPGVVNPSVSTGSGATSGTIYSADIDGDGREDLVIGVTSGSSLAWYVQFATSTGYGPPKPTGITTGDVLLDDFDNSGQVEILASVGGTWNLFKWVGTSFVQTMTNTAVTSGVHYASADVDGDGRPDLVSITPSSNPGYAVEVIWLNQTTTKGNVQFSTAPVTNNLALDTAALHGMKLWGNNKNTNSSVHHFDFDGDGREDLIIYWTKVASQNVIYTAAPLISRGTAPPIFQAGLLATEDVPAGDPIAVNWNDDQCTDLAFDNSLWIAQCNGLIATGFALPSPALAALDWDGDGRTDLLASVTGSSTLQLWRSEGTTMAPATSTGIAVGTGNWLVTDPHGDGMAGLVFANSSTSYALTYGAHNGANVKPDLAIAFTDGYNYKIQPSYSSLAGTSQYQRLSTAPAGYRDFIGHYFVPIQTVYSDPTNFSGLGTFSQQHNWSGAWMNTQGRRFAGFTTFQNVDSRPVPIEKWTRRLDFPYTGFVIEDDLTYLNGSVSTPIKQTTYMPGILVLDGGQYTGRQFPYTQNSTSIEYEYKGATAGPFITTRTTANSSPDNYGNFGTVTSTIIDNDSSSPSPYYGDVWTTQKTAVVTPDTSHWCIGLPTSVSIQVSSTAPNGAAKTRTEQFNNPDYIHCRQTQKVTQPGDSTYQVTEDYQYDAFGNVHVHTITGVGMSPRSTTINWTINGQLPLTITDPLSQTTTLSYDYGTGSLIGQTDFNSTASNTLTTSYTYDNFARELTHVNLDGTSVSTTYSACAPSACATGNDVMIVKQSLIGVGGTVQSTTNTYLDAWDRPVVSSATMLNGAYDRIETQYDQAGNVAQISAPCTFVGCTYYWTTFQHDLVGRLVQTSRPTNSSSGVLQHTLIGYNGRFVTVTDPNGNSTNRLYLVTGSLAQVKDPKGYTESLGYDAMGSLLSVTDSQGSTLYAADYAYGIRAFLKDATDIDLDKSTNAGEHRTYTYNALGELVHWTDAKNQAFSQSFDALSRPLLQTEPDGSTQWTWGSSTGLYNLGQLQSVQTTYGGATESIQYSYDSKTRLSTETYSLPGDASYTYTYTYNSVSGRLDTLQYPTTTSGSPLKLQYAYSNAMLQKISDFNTPSTAYWTVNATNPRGQVTQETLGNGVVVNHTFDAVTGWPSVVTAGVGGGASLLNAAYGFDYLGNLQQRQNNNTGGHTENFYYDNDNRLSHSDLDGNLNLSITYDVNGNFLRRSDVASGATWTYDPVRKHAVTQAGSSSFTYSYDNNGNAITRNGYPVSWTSFNYPASISTSNEETAFSYGAYRERWKTLYTSSTTTETTYRASNRLEKVATSSGVDYRHYIFSGGQPIAVYSRTNSGVNTLRYLLQDFPGSYASVLSSTGATYVAENFSAFGNRRNPSSWSGAPTTTDENLINAVSRNGYIGESVLGVSMGLNHLNGRVQDSITGRFLSPDPFIPDASDTQSYNRYSYANNNPLSLVDTNGFDEEPPQPPDITVTGTPPSNGNPGGGDFTGGGGIGTQLSTEEIALINSGLAGTKHLENGFSDNLYDDVDKFIEWTGFWLDFHGSERYFSTDSEGNQKGFVGGIEDLPTAELTVTAARSQWIPWASCGTSIECGGIPIGRSGLLRAVGPVLDYVGLYVTTVASMGLSPGGATAVAGRVAGAGPLWASTTKGVPAAAKFAQRSFGAMFSKGGPLAGRSVAEVSNAIRTGAMDASDVEVNYIYRNGQPLILNTRSSAALEQAGVPRALWNGKDQTGVDLFERLLDGQLKRNPGAPFTSIRPSLGTPAP